MITCIYDAQGIQLCCCIGLPAALAYLELFQLEQSEVILETIFSGCARRLSRQGERPSRARLRGDRGFDWLLAAHWKRPRGWFGLLPS